MWTTRMFVIVAVAIGLSACNRETDNPAEVSSSSSHPAQAEAPPAEKPAKTTAPTVKPPAPPSTSQGSQKATPPVAATTSPPQPAKSAAAPAAPVPLDLDALEKQLKATKAIGVFSKIALKNQVDDLMKKFREHYQGKSKTNMTELHQSYDLLIMKVLSMVQDDDKNLAAAIVSSRTAIWNLLADPRKFAELDA